MANRLLCRSLLLGFALAAGSCTGGPDSEIGQPARITVAQWGQEKYLIYLPLYLAMEGGFFAQEGIDVSLKFSGNDDQVFATVLKGEAQFGVGDPVFTAIARERGGRGTVVASIVNGVAIWGVTNRADLRPINRPEDLRGLRIGTFPAPSTNYTLMRKTILNAGPLLAGTKIVEAPIGAQVALLENGAADIAMELEPGASIAESMGYRVVYSSPKFYGPFAFTGLTVAEEFVHSNPGAVQKIVNGLGRALTFAHEDEAGAVAVAAKLFPRLDNQVVAAAVRRMLTEKTIPEDPVVSEEAWQKALQVRLDVGDLGAAQPTSVCVDNTFAQKFRAQGDRK